MARGKLWSWAAAALVLACHAGVVASMPHETFWSPDEGAKYVQMRSLHWDGGLRYEIPYRGHSLDPDYAIYPSNCRYGDFYPAPLDDGSIRFHWPLWFPAAAALFHALFGTVGLYVIPVLAGWSICLLAGALAARFAPGLTAPAILLTGLATPVGFYSVVFWEHTLVTAFALAAVVLVAAALRRGASRGRAVPALLLLCAAVVLRLEMIAFALAVVVSCLAVLRPRPAELRAWLLDPGRRRWVAAALLAVAVTAVFVLADLPPRHVWNLQQFASRLVAVVRKLPALPGSLVEILINSDGHQGPRLPAFVGWGGLVAVVAALVAPWLRAPRAGAALTLVSLAALGQLGLLLVALPQPYLSLHGVIAAAPYIVLGAYALATLGADAAANRFVLYTGAAYAVFGVGILVILLTDRAGEYQTGLEWGARNVLTLYPLGVVASLAALAAYRQSRQPPLVKRLVVSLAVALMFESALLEVRGVRMLGASRVQAARWQQALPVDQPIVTDSWWLPLAIAPFYVEHVMHCALDAELLVPWAARARAQGYEHAALATLAPPRRSPLLAAEIGFRVEEQIQTEGLHVATVLLPPGAD